MASYENLSVAYADGIATITFTRERALNALNAATLDDLDAALTEAASAAQAIILTGAGKAFVAGADISTMPSMSPAEARTFSARGSALFARMEALPIPWSLQSTASRSAAVASSRWPATTSTRQRAKFGQPEVQLGLVAGFGGTQLARKVPHGVAMELLLSGRMIKADEALRIGLVNRRRA